MGPSHSDKIVLWAADLVRYTGTGVLSPAHNIFFCVRARNEKKFFALVQVY